MRLQMEMAEKLAEGFSPHAAFEAKHKQSGHDQTEEPGAAFLGFPQRRFRLAVGAVHRLEVTMHAAFGKSGLLRKASDALLPGFTNRVENDQALGPQSHGGGPCSEGWLKLCLKSALQSTRSTTHCPALETWPEVASIEEVESRLAGRWPATLVEAALWKLVGDSAAAGHLLVDLERHTLNRTLPLAILPPAAAALQPLPLPDTLLLEPEGMARAVPLASGTPGLCPTVDASALPAQLREPFHRNLAFR